MVSGGAMIFLWKYLVRPLGGAWNIYELLPAFLVSCLFIVVVSLVTAVPGKAVTDEFDAVKKMR
jgi:sodium/proline symporter